jgi:peptidylprolyl isomerase
VLRTDTATFAAFVAARRTRLDSWFVEPTGRVELCNVAVPVRVRALTKP